MVKMAPDMPEHLDDMAPTDESNMAPEIDKQFDEVENVNAVSQTEPPSDKTDDPDIASQEETVSPEGETTTAVDSADDEPSLDKTYCPGITSPEEAVSPETETTNPAMDNADDQPSNPTAEVPWYSNYG